MEYEQYEQYLADKRGQTIQQLRQWLNEERLIIVPCRSAECEYGNCKGWRIEGRELTNEELLLF